MNLPLPIMIAIFVALIATIAFQFWCIKEFEDENEEY